MPIDFRRRKIRVFDTIVVLDTERDLHVVDISEDMSRVAALMAWWGSVHAECEREKVLADARYRQWRAAETNALASSGLPEWKVKAAIESKREFLVHKEEIARTEANVIAAKAQFDAFAKKGNILQSRGAMEREERSKQGMVTRAAPKRPAPEPDDEEELDTDTTEEAEDSASAPPEPSPVEGRRFPKVATKSKL